MAARSCFIGGATAPAFPFADGALGQNRALAMPQRLQYLSSGESRRQRRRSSSMSWQRRVSSATQPHGNPRSAVGRPRWIRSSAMPARQPELLRHKAATEVPARAAADLAQRRARVRQPDARSCERWVNLGHRRPARWPQHPFLPSVLDRTTCRRRSGRRPPGGYRDGDHPHGHAQPFGRLAPRLASASRCDWSGAADGAVSCAAPAASARHHPPGDSFREERPFALDCVRARSLVTRLRDPTPRETTRSIADDRPDEQPAGIDAACRNWGRTSVGALK